MIALIKDFLAAFWGGLEEFCSDLGELLLILIFGKEKELEPDIVPFIVSEYLDRMEKANLDILEAQKPVDKTIILWCGLDGLRLNEEGSLEWISRKKPEPVNQNVSWQPYQTANVRATFDMCQSPQAQIDALRMQLAQQMQNAAIINSLPITHIDGCAVAQPTYLYYSQLADCCCIQQWR